MSNPIRFAAFEADVRAGELRKDGELVRLQEQPFRLLVLLLERPGEVVTRDEIREALWSADEYVEFEHSLNTAVNRLRTALGDSASEPQYIETVPRRGYRFIGRAGEAELPAHLKPGPVVRGWRLGVLGLLVGAVALVWSLVPEDRSEMVRGEPLRAVPLTSLDGVEDFPTFSPDGSQVSFQWIENDAASPGVYVKSIGSEAVRRLTPEGVEARFPAWSPDGSQIAYVRVDAGQCDLLVISPAGGGSREVTSLTCASNDLFYSHLSWSPDGSVLVFPDQTKSDEAFALFAVALESGERWQLTAPPPGVFGDDGPSFAFDGSQLAFVRRRSAFTASEIRVLDIDGHGKPIGASREVPVYRPGSEQAVRGANCVVWAEGNRDLIYLAGGAVWRVQSTGGQATQLAAFGDWLKAAALHTARRRFAFARQTPDVDIWRVEVASGENRPLISSTKLDWFHSISPDGSRVAWTSWRSGHSEIWVANAEDGSDALQLTDLKTQSGSPQWSPDSERLVFDTRVSGDADVYIVGASGGKPAPLVDGPEDDLQPVWSADGKLVYFGSLRDGEPAVWSVNVETGALQRESQARSLLARVSPDGRYLYFRERDRGMGDGTSALYRKTLADGEEIVVLEDHASMAPAKRGFYYGVASPPSVHYFDPGTGERRKIADLPKSPGTIAVTPDESTILYTQAGETGADLMLIENFR